MTVADVFVICGSATTWIVKKVFRNKGGLYNRATGRIFLEPFTLAECRELMWFCEKVHCIRKSVLAIFLTNNEIIQIPPLPSARAFAIIRLFG